MDEPKKSNLLLYLLLNSGFWGIVLAIAHGVERVKEHPGFIWLMLGCIAIAWVPFLLPLRKQS